MGIRTAVKQVLIAQQDKKYEKELAQLKVTYEQWAAEQDRESAEPREIAGLVEFVIFRHAADDWQIMRQSGSTLILQSIRKQKSSTVMKT